MLLGCCLHHAHADLPVNQRDHDTTESACPCHHHDDDGQGTPAGHSKPGHSNGQECEDTHCVFTPIVSRVSVDAAEALTPWSASALFEVVAPPGTPREHADFIPIRGAPIRLHLLNQTLLL